ncbi:hypothetical protein BU24DRAFT_279344 [Aaosphaeria arxii CBS 175.79]|uniref:Uncharacterized protein n=1 Tax=Aaosphaeria arxii CBS 175.79 TaxID=1450172 RepID=A0A6A5XEL0_9PLEO|nr:uncharacterized protein BU24DRAFT_279344 [Aaosphaeria arxii CBS 175.79]KAF2011343.1 hypothetical protein BU24DRAFT_279344 [Aaosphaeria arxii CBS 175.79]
MKLSASIASTVLLLTPLLAGAAPLAAPTTAVADVTSIAEYPTIRTISTTPNARSIIVARDPKKCDAPVPDSRNRAKPLDYQSEIRRMKDFTAAAHTAENQCRITDFPAY